MTSTPTPPPAPVKIRPATADDGAALAAVDQVSWDHTSGFPSMRESKEEFFNERSTPERHLLAEYDGRIVGYIRILPKTPILENAHVFGIWGFAVIPGVRGLGVGSALLEAAENTAREQGGRKISLHVFSTNATARRLYEKHGFFPEGIAKDEFYIEGEYIDDIMLTKSL